MQETFEIVNERDEVIGSASRAECHNDPSLIHCTAHVVVRNAAGDLLLQKRSEHKDIQPGKWDTAVGGHLAPGESYETAARRELEEELGIQPPDTLSFLFNSCISNAFESEHVRVFGLVYEGPFYPPEDEIEELVFWSQETLARATGTGVFTPNLEHELQKLHELNL